MTTWQPGQFVADERMAELMAAHHMRILGHPDAHATPAGSDGGIDVASARAIAQVKYRAQITGRPDLQLLVGAREEDLTLDLWFFSISGYSPQALEYADRLNICLLTYDVNGNLQGHNDAGRQALAAPVFVAQPPAHYELPPRTTFPRPTVHRTPRQHLVRNAIGITAAILGLVTFAIGKNARALDALSPTWATVFVATGTAAVLLAIVFALQLAWRRAR